MFPEIKPRNNSFVWQNGQGEARTYLYLEKQVAQRKRIKKAQASRCGRRSCWRSSAWMAGVMSARAERQGHSASRQKRNYLLAGAPAGFSGACSATAPGKMFFSGAFFCSFCSGVGSGLRGIIASRLAAFHTMIASTTAIWVVLP